LAARGADVDLVSATALGELDRVEALLRRDPASVNVRGAYRFTPLEESIWWNRKEIAEFLIDHGAELNPKDGISTPLHIAAEAGWVGLGEMLLTRGANANATNSAGWTALHVAVVAGESDMINLLHRHGAKESRLPVPQSIGVRCQNSPLESVAPLLATLTGKSVVVPNSAWATVWYASESGMTAQDVVNGLVSSLQSNGFTMVTINDAYTRIVRCDETNTLVSARHIDLSVVNNNVSVQNQPVRLQDLASKLQQLSDSGTELWIHAGQPALVAADGKELHWMMLMRYMGNVKTKGILQVYRPRDGSIRGSPRPVQLLPEPPAPTCGKPTTAGGSSELRSKREGFPNP
jgi:ankyrin repeat protein